MIFLGLFAAGTRLAEWLPGPLLYGLARLIGLLLSTLPSPPRAKLRRNLATVLDLPAQSAALRPYLRSVYQAQAANYVDLLRSRVIASSKNVVDEIVQDGDGWPALEGTLAQGRGLVLVTAHFGRIELMTHLLGSRDIPVTLPVERLQPPALFDLLCRLRSRPTFTLVAADLGLRPCLRALGRGNVVVFFADWDSTGHGVTVPFFGLPARLPAGPALVAVRTGAPLFVGFNAPAGPDGRQRGIIESPLPVERSGDFDADVQRTTQTIATALERYIRRCPGQWVMFHEIWPRQSVQITTVSACGAQAPRGVSR